MSITQDERSSSEAEAGLTDKEQEICSVVTNEMIDLIKLRMNLFDNTTSAISMALHVLLNSTGNFILNVAKLNHRQEAINQFCDSLNEWLKDATEQEKNKP